MWDYLLEHENGKIRPELEACVYVGDQSGRIGLTLINFKLFNGHFLNLLQVLLEVYRVMIGHLLITLVWIFRLPKNSF